MKSLKYFLGLFLAAVLVFAFGHNADASSYLAIGVMVTPDVKRGYLAIFVDYLKKQYGLTSISEMDLRPYNIRLLWDIKNNQTSYKLDPRGGYKGTNVNLATMELLLEDKKIFFASELRVASRKIDANAQLGPVFTYPDILHHDDTGEAVALESLYNGVTTLVTDNVNRITALSNDGFRFVPNRIKAETADAVTAWPNYGPSNEERGFISLAPTPILDSSKNNSIVVDLKGSTAAIEGAANKKNILQVDLLGWIFDPSSSGNGFCGSF